MVGSRSLRKWPQNITHQCQRAQNTYYDRVWDRSGFYPSLALALHFQSAHVDLNQECASAIVCMITTTNQTRGDLT